jgi:hypothetical protein
MSDRFIGHFDVALDCSNPQNLQQQKAERQPQKD